MRVLIAGLGSIGQRHLKNLSALGVRDLLLYRTGRSTLANDDLTRFPVFSDLSLALDERPQAIVIANPTALHLDVAVPAARRGCALLIEKPVASAWDKVPELQAAVREGGAKVLVGYQFRFHPTLRRARELIRKGELGEIVSARAVWGESLPGWHPWEDFRTSYAARAELGGGAILTLSHPLDYLLWLLGDVKSVMAQTGGGNSLRIEAEDSAEMVLAFDSGALASVHVDFLLQPASHTLTLLGTKGMAVWDAADGTLRWTSNAGTAEWHEVQPPIGFDRNTMFLDEMRHFLQIAEGVESPVCSLDDGLKGLGVALAALESAWSGTRVDMGMFNPAARADRPRIGRG